MVSDHIVPDKEDCEPDEIRNENIFHDLFSYNRPLMIDNYLNTLSCKQINVIVVGQVMEEVFTLGVVCMDIRNIKIQHFYALFEAVSIKKFLD